jgi:hypothetical protein
MNMLQELSRLMNLEKYKLYEIKSHEFFNDGLCVTKPKAIFTSDKNT